MKPMVNNAPFYVLAAVVGLCLAILVLFITSCDAVVIDTDKIQAEYNTGYAAGYSKGYVDGVATVNMTDKINCPDIKIDWEGK